MTAAGTHMALQSKSRVEKESHNSKFKQAEDWLVYAKLKHNLDFGNKDEFDEILFTWHRTNDFHPKLPINELIVIYLTELGYLIQEQIPEYVRYYLDKR